MLKKFSNVTTTQLARICGVSQGTVDRALHDRKGIKKETREKILKIAKEYDYVPQIGGSVGQSMIIGVVLYDLYNDFFSRIAMSLVNEAKKVGYVVNFFFSNKDIKQEKSAIDYFNYIGVDAIIIFSVGSDGKDYENYLRSINKPVVTIGNKIGEVAYIGIEDKNAMSELTLKVLQESKMGRIEYFSPVLKKELNSQNAQRLRLDAFIETAEENNVEYKIVTDVEDLSQDASGIICSTDYYLLQVLKKLKNSNAVIAGFDGLPIIDYFDRKIYTVKYSTDEIANQCLRYCLGRRYNKKIKHTVI